MAKDQTAPSFPSHFADPREKVGENWMYQMVTAIWGEWGCQSINSFQKGQERYSMNRLYAMGKQPVDIYKPLFDISEDENSSYVNLDFSPLPVIPKFRRIVNNRFAKIPFTVTAEAIDPYALDEKADYEAEERANIQVRGLLNELGISSDTLNSGESDQPQDEEELSIKMQFGYKHSQAIDIEERIDAVFTHEKIDEKLSVAREYGFDTGVYCLKISTNPVTGRVEIRNVDTSQLVISPTKDPYFRDIWYAGELILQTIDTIREAARATGVELNEDQLAELAAKNGGQNGNPKYFTNSTGGTYAYDSCKVPVFDLEFLSCDRYWYEKRWSRKGYPVIGRVSKPGNRSDREYFSDERTVVYRCKWIPGTKIMYDYGLKTDVAVKRDRNQFETLLSYKIVAPELNNMETSPIIENLIPSADQVSIAWYKLQNVIARARPKGIMIEIGALEDISLGDAGEDGAQAMRPIDVLDMFSQTGLLVYRRINFEGEASNYKPIEELNNGLGSEAAEYFAVIDAHMQKIRELIGFNDITDGSTPDPKMLNGVAGMAAEATNNALHQLYDAERKLIEMVAEDVAIRVHDSIAFKTDSPYQYVMAPDVVKNIKEHRNKIHREFSIAIEYGSDKFEKEKLQGRIEKAIDNQSITLADALAVENCRNLKQAEQILAYRIKKNAERVAQQKQREFMDNAKASMQASQQAEEEKRKTLQVQNQFKLAEIEAKKKADEELLILKYKLEAETIHDPDRANKLDSEKIKADAVVESAKIKKQQPSQVLV